MADLSNARVLMIAADGFETVELFEPKKALEAAGATVTLASIKRDPIQGMEQDINKAEMATPDLTLAEVDTDDYDALVIPAAPATRQAAPGRAGGGDRRGVHGGRQDRRRHLPRPLLLAEADVIDGRRLTSYPSIRTDLENAGARSLMKKW